MSLFAKDVKTNNFTNPLGINPEELEFSWCLTGDGKLQTAYQLQAAGSVDDLQNGKLIWDSGKVKTSSSCGHLWGGSPLKSRDRVFFRVMVWDEDDLPGDWSKTASFEIGLCRSSDWNAMYMGFPGGHAGKALYYSTHFQVKTLPQNARLYYSGSWSEFFINGVQLRPDELLQPAETDYNKSVHYLTYDITDLLQIGDNVLGLHTGQGWYGAPVVRYQLEGDGELLTSSHTFSMPLAYPSAVERNSIYDGEDVNAAKECDPDWKKPGQVLFPYCRNAQRVPGPVGIPRGLEEEPIRRTAEYPAQKTVQLGTGHYTVDFGQNFAGWCRLKIEAPSGTAIEMSFAETLNTDGTVNQDNLLGARAKDIYICSGKGIEIYEPHFTFHGFRYCEIKGLPGEIRSDTLTGIGIRTDCPEIGSFKCDNELLNRIYRMIKHTETSNLLAVPTDCPQRTERMGWVNDLIGRCEGALYAFDESNLLTKWLRDIAETQDPETGEIQMTAPFHWGFEIDAVCSGFIEAAQLNYAFFGRRANIKALFPAMKKWVDCMINNCDADGILRKGGFVGDWCPPAKFNGSSSPQNNQVPHELVGTCIMHYAVSLLSKLARLLDRKSDAEELLRSGAKIRQDFLKQYHAGHGRLNVDCQSAYAFAIYCGLLPDEELQSAADYLAEMFKNNSNKNATGFVGTKFLLEILTVYGHVDQVWEFLNSTDYPSYGFMLENGATTLWERWENETGYGMNSHNHPMLGSPAAWFMRHGAGIQVLPETCGFDKFQLKPQFSCGLNEVEAVYQSRAGKIVSNWKKTGNSVVWDFEIPTGSTALVHLPGKTEIFFCGKYHLEFDLSL